MNTPHPRGAFSAFVLKETRHILRDRQTLVVLIILPFIMVLLFGFAIRTDVEEVRLVVVDASRDSRSRDLVRNLSSTTALYVVGVKDNVSQVEPLLRTGEAAVALVLPTGFARALETGTAAVLIESDGINANYAATSENYVRVVVQSWAAQQGFGTPSIRMDTRMRFNPTLASENLFIPGLLAFVLILISALMTAISLAREKETGTMEVLLVSPLRPLQIIVGKVVPYLALAFFNGVTALAVAWTVFRVPIRGSLALLLAAILLYVLVSLALGILISSLVPDQRTAMMTTLLGLLIPTLALSGFIFPISSMPAWLSPFADIVPATWFILVARGIMLKGIGAILLWKEFLVLGAMAVALLFAASRSLTDRTT